jgi:hypothetical protein
MNVEHATWLAVLTVGKKEQFITFKMDAMLLCNNMLHL